ncbi:MAG: hypothetical protein IT210_05375 [Armatimonadetes bacterium]|nr:hypothetical protein [Armatimonadota bacterium]
MIRKRMYLRALGICWAVLASAVLEAAPEPRYNILPGGVRSVAELRIKIRKNPLARQVYRHLAEDVYGESLESFLGNLEVVRTPKTKGSVRVLFDDGRYHPIRMKKNEVVFRHRPSGRIAIRGKCGNAVWVPPRQWKATGKPAIKPPKPVPQTAPPQEALPSPQVAYLFNPTSEPIAVGVTTNIEPEFAPNLDSLPSEAADIPSPIAPGGSALTIPLLIGCGAQLFGGGSHPGRGPDPVTPPSVPEPAGLLVLSAACAGWGIALRKGRRR